MRSAAAVPAHPWLLAPFEPGRAALELATLPLAAPGLLGARGAFTGPVVVVPGLSGGNGWTTMVRSHLRLLGHSLHRLPPGTMLGRPGSVVPRLIDLVDEVAQREGSPVGGVGWSVGGAFTRQVALARPELVRLLVTLGSPLDGIWYDTTWSAAREPLPVPVTAVHSRSDGIFDWRRCLVEPSDRAENVEIVSSHLGMGSHPAALHVVADRLGQSAGGWAPYRRPSSWPGATP